MLILAWLFLLALVVSGYFALSWLWSLFRDDVLGFFGRSAWPDANRRRRDVLPDPHSSARCNDTWRAHAPTNPRY